MQKEMDEDVGKYCILIVQMTTKLQILYRGENNNKHLTSSTFFSTFTLELSALKFSEFSTKLFWAIWAEHKPTLWDLLLENYYLDHDTSECAQAMTFYRRNTEISIMASTNGLRKF